MQVNKDVIFREAFSYYTGSKYNTFLKATRKNFHAFFANKDLIKFIKGYEINFNKEEDFKTLLTFCEE